MGTGALRFLTPWALLSVPFQFPPAGSSSSARATCECLECLELAASADYGRPQWGVSPGIEMSSVKLVYS